MYRKKYQKSLVFILKSLTPFPIEVCAMLWVALFWSVDLSLRPYIFKIIINIISSTSSERILNELLFPCLYYFILTFIMFNSARLNTFFFNVKLVPQLRKNIGISIINNLFNKNYNSYLNNSSGSLTSKINDLTNHVPDCIQILFDRFLSYILALIIAFYFLSKVSIVFSVIMILWSILFIFFAILKSKTLIHLSANLAQHNSILTGKIIDIFTNIQSVFLFSQKNHETNLMIELYSYNSQLERKLNLQHLSIWVIYDYSYFIVLLVNFLVLIKGRIDGWISVGDFIVVITINLSIVDFLWKFTREFANFTKALGKITNALDSINSMEDIVTSKNLELKIEKGEITFQNICFSYNKKHKIFNNLSITIFGKQKIGIVGYSGVGKTSLINLFLRLYPLDSGNIFIDSYNIKDTSYKSFYQQITLMMQEAILFNRSIYENIAYGSSDVNQSDVIEAAKKAHIHDFIITLPNLYKTCVGERGVRLSGGQKQRILLARAFLKDSPILILDEPTSQLDTVTEKIIQQSIKTLIENKTVIVIAHRISTLSLMDRIIVMDKEKIVGDGHHKELIKQNTIYKKLWQNQHGGFLESE